MSKSVDSHTETTSSQLDLFASSESESSEFSSYLALDTLSDADHQKLYESVRSALDAGKKSGSKELESTYLFVWDKLDECKQRRNEFVHSCRLRDEKKIQFHIYPSRRPDDFLASARISRDGRWKDWNKVASDIGYSYFKVIADLIESAVPGMRKPQKKHARG